MEKIKRFAENIDQARMRAFQQKYLEKLKREYEQTMASFKEDVRRKKEQKILESLESLSRRLTDTKDFEFGEMQKETLKLKLARYFQLNETCDLNTLYDAVVETPKFINADKGSLYHLFEIHEQKTLEKIAQIRKQRAEMTGDETYNPYEALLRTDSGKYYMARLLNMPHLEEESEYMNHCVGTSDSYVNRMKRGEIEILSFRHTPESGIKNDQPILTFEYDPKNKMIIQMKKADDNYLRKEDPYFGDVIDALKKMRETRIDTGELRDFKEISKSELENIEVSNYHILTDEGEIHFRNFDPANSQFVFKMGKMNITPEMPGEDAAKIIQIITGEKVRPEEIARRKEEVNQNTRIYIGPLYEEILYSNIEQIYASFPEDRIGRGKIEIGGMTEEELEQAIKNKKDEQGRCYQISPHAESMMKHRDFLVSVEERLKNPETINLVRLKVRDLGFTENPTTDELYKRAGELGLELCPPETGAYLRLKYEEVFKREQPMYEYLRIAMKQITVSVGALGIFRMARNAGGFWLGNDWADPSSWWSLGGGFVFRLRKET